LTRTSLNNNNNSNNNNIQIFHRRSIDWDVVIRHMHSFSISYSCISTFSFFKCIAMSSLIDHWTGPCSCRRGWRSGPASSATYRPIWRFRKPYTTWRWPMAQVGAQSRMFVRTLAETHECSSSKRKEWKCLFGSLIRHIWSAPFLQILTMQSNGIHGNFYNYIHNLRSCRVSAVPVIGLEPYHRVSNMILMCCSVCCYPVMQCMLLWPGWADSVWD